MWIGVFIGSLVVLSTCLWPIAWLGLELNLMCFVAAVIIGETLKKPSMMYFVAQRIGSLSILFMGILRDFTCTAHWFLLFGIVLKLGLLPLHF